MIVVSNTSPLNYLVLIDAVDLLHQLFGAIIIPPAVHDELSDIDAPDPVQRWIARRPDWLDVRNVVQHADTELKHLHRGEREALMLAEELDADLVLLDERTARIVAIQRGLRVTGTLGVLSNAGQHSLVNVSQAVERLKRTTFRASPHLYKWLLEQQGKRIP